MWFGDESRFAMCVKGRIESESPSTLVVDVYAAGRWLTCDDNSVFVPHFAGMLKHEVGRMLLMDSRRYSTRPYPDLSFAENYERLRSAASGAEGDEVDYQHFRHALFMDWGPTADNVSALLFHEGDTAIIPFAFLRPEHHDPTELGQVFVAEVPFWELAGILHEVAWKLMGEWAGYWASRS